MKHQLFSFATGLLMVPVALVAQTATQMIKPAQTLSVSINRSAAETYAYVSVPENFPKWAPGFCLSMRPAAEKNVWDIVTSAGPAKVRFVEKNNYGIVDHYVTPEKGGVVYIAMRVLENGPGSEVIFTLFRQPEMTDEIYARDKAAVQKDLESLKQVLER